MAGRPSPSIRPRRASRRPNALRFRWSPISWPPPPSNGASCPTGRRARPSSSAPMRRRRSPPGSRASRRSASMPSRPAAEAFTTPRPASTAAAGRARDIARARLQPVVVHQHRLAARRRRRPVRRRAAPQGRGLHGERRAAIERKIATLERMIAFTARSRPSGANTTASPRARRKAGASMPSCSTSTSGRCCRCRSSRPRCISRAPRAMRRRSRPPSSN